MGHRYTIFLAVGALVALSCAKRTEFPLPISSLELVWSFDTGG